MKRADFARVTWGEEFSKDLKKLRKRYRTLEEDLETFIRAQLFSYHKLQIDNHGLVPISDLGSDAPQVYKAKKFACRALKGSGARSGLRVIYTYIAESDEIYLMEIYSKSDKSTEDRKRIKEIIRRLGNAACQ